MSRVAIIRDDRYLEHNPGDGHPESPDRLRAVHDLLDREFSGLPLIPPRLASETELTLVHDPFYIKTVAKTEGRSHSQLDPDTGLSARSYEISRLAAGGLLQGIDALLQNTPVPGVHERTQERRVQSENPIPKSVFTFVRPPGHHAMPDRGMGFCLFNNVAIAAEYAKKTYGLRRILIVDWDLHHGNGTQQAFYSDSEVLFFSSHQYPYYPGSGKFDQVGSGVGEGFTVNAPFPAGFGDAEYIAVYERVLKPISLEYQPELILVSAGFDPYVKDPLGGMRVTGPGFGALASLVRDLAEQTCGGKVLLTLEGGYHPDGLREGVGSVLNALLGQSADFEKGRPSEAAEQVIERIASVQKAYWNSLK